MVVLGPVLLERRWMAGPVALTRRAALDHRPGGCVGLCSGACRPARSPGARAARRVAPAGSAAQCAPPHVPGKPLPPRRDEGLYSPSVEWMLLHGNRPGPSASEQRAEEKPEWKSHARRYEKREERDGEELRSGNEARGANAGSRRRARQVDGTGDRDREAALGGTHQEAKPPSHPAGRSRRAGITAGGGRSTTGGPLRRGCESGRRRLGPSWDLADLRHGRPSQVAGDHDRPPPDRQPGRTRARRGGLSRGRCPRQRGASKKKGRPTPRRGFDAGAEACMMRVGDATSACQMRVAEAPGRGLRPAREGAACERLAHLDRCALSELSRR